MEHQELIALLNRALQVELRSFAHYCREVAHPNFYEGDDVVRHTFAEIAADGTNIADTIATMVEELGARPDPTPSVDLRYFQYNFLDADFLLNVCVEQLAASRDAFAAVVGRVPDAAPQKERLKALLGRKAEHVEKLAALLEERGRTFSTLYRAGGT